MGRVALPASMLRALPAHVQSELLPARTNLLRSQVVRVSTAPAQLNALLMWLPDQPSRRAAYLAGHSAPAENGPVLRR